MPDTQDEFDEGKRICSNCVGETYLRQDIRDNGEDLPCSYCGNEAPSFEIEKLADLIERAFEDHYARTATEPDGWESAMLSDRECDYEWERAGEEVVWAIAEAAEIDEPIAEDIQGVLEDRHDDFEMAKMCEECEFAKDSHYSRKEPDKGEFPYLWESFKSELKTKARFFSRSARGILEEIFGDIQSISTTEGRTAVVDAGPGTKIEHLFRARVFRNEDHKLNEALAYPWNHLGTPPTAFARAGRMNAGGIAVFYGTFEADTALAEVRPPVGSKVAMARFNLLRPLKLLDLDALTTVSAGGSIFDPSTTVNLQRADFLRFLSYMMSQAVMPHEEETEYLPTQAVAEYLATEAGLDGIVFPSVQTGHGASNVVLFHHAARVAEVALPPGSEVSGGFSIGDPDDPFPEYSVWEKVPDTSEESDRPEATRLPFEPLSDDPLSSYDDRLDTLSVELASVEVHNIRAVSFQSESLEVSRIRLTKTELNWGKNKGEDELI